MEHNDDTLNLVNIFVKTHIALPCLMCLSDYLAICLLVYKFQTAPFPIYGIGLTGDFKVVFYISVLTINFVIFLEKNCKFQRVFTYTKFMKINIFLISASTFLYNLIPEKLKGSKQK